MEVIVILVLPSDSDRDSIMYGRVLVEVTVIAVFPAITTYSSIASDSHRHKGSESGRLHASCCAASFVCASGEVVE